LLDAIGETGEMDESAMREAIEGFASSWTSPGHPGYKEAAALRSEDADAKIMREGEHRRPVGEA
jgi:hypothetical protein